MPEIMLLFSMCVQIFATLIIISENQLSHLVWSLSLFLSLNMKFTFNLKPIKQDVAHQSLPCLMQLL